MSTRHIVRVHSKPFLRLLALLFLCLTAASKLLAQGNVISYQGRLSDSGSPANTNYDFRFAVFTAPTNGTMVSIWITNLTVPVANGLFSTTLNFGSNIFNGTLNGSNDWLDVSVRASSASTFTTLYPREPILPVPYALFAVNASNLLGTLAAAQVVGTLPASTLGGAYTNTVNFTNGTNTFYGAFFGNGLNLTNLNASSVINGTLPDAQLPLDTARLGQNQTFTGANTFSGTETHSGTYTFSGTGTYSGPNLFTASNTFTGVSTFTNWNNSFVGSFYGNGLVGWNVVIGNSQSAVRDHGYMVTNPLVTTITLPTSPLTNVDIVRVSGAGAGGWTVAAAGGQTIVGNFANYGNCFPVQTFAGSYLSIAASADVIHQYMVVNASPASVSASADSGTTWTTIAALSGNFLYVACSANGRIVYAAPTSGGIRKSTDGGASWTTLGTTTTGFISCSADGSQLFVNNTACSGTGTFRAMLSGGTVSISTNSGASSAPISTPTTVACVAVSSDCHCIVVGANPGLLYASANRGSTWTALTTTNQIWSGASMSPDGSHLAASATTSGVIQGGLYRGSVTPLPNTSATSLTGSFGSAVELQYIGNNQFIPVSSSGLIWANP